MEIEEIFVDVYFIRDDYVFYDREEIYQYLYVEDNFKFIFLQDLYYYDYLRDYLGESSNNFYNVFVDEFFYIYLREKSDNSRGNRYSQFNVYYEQLFFFID